VVSVFLDWKGVGEWLVRREELLLSLEFLKRYNEELRAINRGKVCCPYTLIYSHMVFLDVVRYLFGVPYRQIEDFVRALNHLVPKLPSADNSGLRRRILDEDFSPYESLELAS